MTCLVLLDQALRLHDNPLLWYGAAADNTADGQPLVAVHSKLSHMTH